MTVVLDANALVALLASEPHGPTIAELIERWIAEERELHAPALRRVRPLGQPVPPSAPGLRADKFRPFSWAYFTSGTQ